MGTISTLIIVIFGYCGCIGAMIVTTYEKSSPVLVSGLVQCGVTANSFDYCAARVTNNSCEPLTRDWCVSKEMSDGAVYMIKQIMTLQGTSVDRYIHTVPIHLNDGSEMEFKIMLHDDWTGYRCFFYDDSSNTVLHIAVHGSGDMYVNSYDPNLGYGKYSIPVDALHTLKIVCATNGFQIYLNDILERTYLYHLPADTIRNPQCYTYGADVYQVTYRAGH